MSLTDGRIMAIARTLTPKNWFDEDYTIDFARAIEQEVVIAEATKLSKFLNETESKEPFVMKELGKQEPVGQFTVSGGRSINQIIKFETYLPDGDYQIYASPQPCPDLGTCDECGSQDSYDPRDKGSICVTCMMGKNKVLQEKVAELEAELSEFKLAYAESTRQKQELMVHRRADVKQIKELEAELADCTTSNKAVEAALNDVPYNGTYADGVEWLKSRLELDGTPKYDGMFCRDATIRMQDARIAELEAELASARLYKPAQRSDTQHIPVTQLAPTEWQKWGMELAEEVFDGTGEKHQEVTE